MKHYTWQRNYHLDDEPIDRNDPGAAATAQPLCFPHELSDNAWRLLNYLDDTAWLFAYKGQLVVTDESLELTSAGDGTPGNPLGFPRWTGDSFEAMEAWLEAEFEIWMEEDPENRPFDRDTPVTRWSY